MHPDPPSLSCYAAELPSETVHVTWLKIWNHPWFYSGNLAGPAKICFRGPCRWSNQSSVSIRNTRNPFTMHKDAAATSGCIIETAYVYTPHSIYTTYVYIPHVYLESRQHEPCCLQCRWTHLNSATRANNHWIQGNDSHEYLYAITAIGNKSIQDGRHLVPIGHPIASAWIALHRKSLCNMLSEKDTRSFIHDILMNNGAKIL